MPIHPPAPACLGCADVDLGRPGTISDSLVAVLYRAGGRSRLAVALVGSWQPGPSWPGCRLEPRFLPSVLGAAAGGNRAVASRSEGAGTAPTAHRGSRARAGRAHRIGRWGCLLNGLLLRNLDRPALGRALRLPASTAYFLHQALACWRRTQPTHSVFTLSALRKRWLLALAARGIPAAPASAFRAEARCWPSPLAFRSRLDGFLRRQARHDHVWWSVLGQWLGFNLFQWALLACASEHCFWGCSSNDARERLLRPRPGGRHRFSRAQPADALVGLYRLVPGGMVQQLRPRRSSAPSSAGGAGLLCSRLDLAPSALP